MTEVGGSDIPTQLRARLGELKSVINGDVRRQSPSSVSVDTLLDVLVALTEDLRAKKGEQTEMIQGFFARYDGVVKKIQSLRINIDDFATIKLLATGAVGKVFLVKSKLDGKFYAMKKLKKSDLLSQREAAFFMEEKNAMALSRSSTWITSLYAAFQDKEHLYLLMEFAPGGTLDKMMERHDVINERDARFYVAEIVLAIEELHKHQYIHRDIKPANILLDVKGHVRLADFGSCIKTDDSKTVKSSSPVGTPDYIAPEVLRATETGGGYGAECDWWSLGVTLFEMLIGETPFDGDSLMQVYGEIMNHQKTFAFPPDAELSNDARDFISRLIAKRECRMGANGAQELKSHPWLKDIDWQNIRNQPAPWIPDVKGPDDITYCHVANEEFNPIKPAGRSKPSTDSFPGTNLPFIGYNYLKSAVGNVTWEFEGTESGAVMAPRRHSKSGSYASGSLQVTSAADLQRKDDELKKVQLELQRELQKRKDADTGKAALVSEKETLEATVSRLSRELRDSKQLCAKLQQEIEEKEVCIAQSSQPESTTSLESQKRDLEGRLQQLGEEMALVNSDNLELRAKASEAVRERAKAESELKSLETKLVEEVTVRAHLQEKILELSSIRENLISSKEELSRTYTKMELDWKNASEELSKLRSLHEKGDEEFHKQRDSLSEVQKNLNTTAAELAVARTALAEVSADRDRLREKVSEHAKGSNANKSLEDELQSARKKIEDLSKEMEDLRRTHSLTVGELTACKIQLQEAKAAAQSVKSSREDTLRELKELQVKSVKEKSTLQSVISTLETSVRTFEQQRLSAAAELTSALQTSNNLQNQLADSLLLRSTIESEKKQIENDYQTFSRQKLGELQMLSRRNRELEQSLATLESKNKGAQANLDVLFKNCLQLKRRVEDLEKERDDLEKLNIDLKSAERLAQSDRQQGEALRLRMEEEFEQLKLKVEQDHEARVLLEVTESNLREEIEGVSQELAVITSEKESAVSRAVQSEARITELEEQLEAFKRRMKDLEVIAPITPLRRKESDNESAKPPSAKKSPNKFKDLFSITKRQRSQAHEAIHQFNEAEGGSSELPPHSRLSTSLSESQSMALSSAISHSRKHSIDQTSISSSSKSNENLPGSTFDFDVKEISGPLRVPDGKSRKQRLWAHRWAVARGDALYLWDTGGKEPTSQPLSSATEVISLRVAFFYISSVTYAELYHVKECPSIFKIHIHDGQGIEEKGATSLASKPADFHKYLAQLDRDLKVERDVASGALKMVQKYPATHAAYATLKDKLEASNKRIQELEDERAKIINQMRSLGMNVDAVQALETQASPQVLEKWKASLNEKLLSLRGDSEKEEQAKELSRQLKVLEKGSPEAQARVIEILEEGGDGTFFNYKGHKFRLYSQKASERTEFHGCQICHDALWVRSEIVKCGDCSLLSHKQCYKQSQLSCATFSALKKTKPLYFLAQSEQDQRRWISVLERLRREVERSPMGVQFPGSPSSLTSPQIPGNDIVESADTVDDSFFQDDDAEILDDALSDHTDTPPVTEEGYTIVDAERHLGLALNRPPSLTSESHSDVTGTFPSDELPAYDVDVEQAHLKSLDEKKPVEEEGTGKDDGRRQDLKTAKGVVHWVGPNDTLVGLSLRYNVSVESIRVANRLFTNSVFERGCLLIPVTNYSGPLQDVRSEEDERKSLVKRFQIATKCVDTDECWSYMRRFDFFLEKALEEYWSDARWESDHPLNGSIPPHPLSSKIGRASSLTSNASKGKTSERRKDRTPWTGVWKMWSVAT
ncbi:hypothetical protein HDU93_004059, partial [Gonapodya sp. JEL0774]